ncbi:hypothetical protein BFP72_12460 [Reichenbachiella sp. 5M10]|uniref:polysaccharide deacetylase family protein n=1 Tax=Reichenbachiella sp. 5M10 TaxID=1889772 RepID=UPI000C5928DB|nr:polysaccharide deacetylase family protein [Reichenbachiella sp. 5M10]PIB36148.1 hypothetical protein BFP72_12460 [Reichenbachiella sp. 5M10]
MSAFYFKKVPKFIQCLFSSALWSEIPTQKTLYLTFDDGPHEESTLRLLALLDRFDVKATFFCQGKQLHRMSELAAEIVSNGHRLANHGYTHQSSRQIPNDRWLAELEETEKWIDKLTRSAQLYRPPYGRLTWCQYALLRKRETKLVMWSLMPGDFDMQQSDRECLEVLLSQTTAGDVIVLHDHAKTIQRLEFILPAYFMFCQSKGYRFELLS